MMPQSHFILTSIICLVLFPFIGYKGIIVLLSAVLIDIDHYIAYVITQKKLDIFKAFKKYSAKGICVREAYEFPFIFHTIEFQILIFIISFFIPVFRFVLLGTLIHCVQDAISEPRKTWEYKFFLLSKKRKELEV